MLKSTINFRAIFLTVVISISATFLGSHIIQAAPVIYLEWVDDPLETMVINWIEDSGESTLIEYREVGAGGWSTKNANTHDIPGSSKVVYRVKLSDLTTGQGYEFRVGAGSDIHKFRTAPNSLDDPIRFIVGGDILDNDNAQNHFEIAKTDFAKVSKIAATYDPYFVVLGGDLANADGDENNVNQWLDLFELWQENMVTDDGFFIPIVPTMGNHEVPNDYGDDPEDAIFFFSFFSYPQDQWGSKISYGKLDFKEYLSIVTLDSDHAHRIPGNQTTWLDNTLQNRDNFRHVIPVYHVAGWPTFRTLRGTQEDLVRNNWHKVFRKNRIRLVFEHHDHIYKRTHPIGDCDSEIRHELSCEDEYGTDARDGVIYMGGGAWGSNNDRDPNPTQSFWYLDKMQNRVHNFVVVEISNNYRTATAIGEEGQVLDEFTDYVFLDPPQALFAENVTEESFTARWEKVEGATNYRLDISTESDFDSFFRSYNDKSLGDIEMDLTDLDPSKIYYYRVRAQNDLTTSKNSEVISVQLVKVDPDLSSLAVSKDTVQANGEETSTITAIVIDEDGEPVNNFTVELFAEEGNLGVEDNTVQTNEDGEAEFTVFNNEVEIVTYGAIAGQEEITQKVQVTYIPVAPVALSATEVGSRQFKANWEMVEDADYYLLDVATDSSFSNTISGYNAHNVGASTSHTINGINPGTTYFYRVRVVKDDLTGANSQIIKTTTFPDTPVAAEATGVTVVSFMATWNTAEGAENYRLDVAGDPNFEQNIQGYEDLDVGNVQTYEVEGLLPGRDYYYRIQAESGPRLSTYSNIIKASTFLIDTENSEINSAQLRVLANGEQSNEITVKIRDENGNLQENVPVELIAENGNSQIENIQPSTDAEGVAKFGVTNERTETVTYSVIAATTKIGEVSVEFIQDEGILKLGNNFPNPFRFDSNIPLTIPKSMHVELRVFNSLGSPVRTLVNKELDNGYYEVPFNGADLAAGIYFYRLITEEGIKTGKMVLVK